MSSIQEDFFLKSINIDNIFKTFEKADYLFLYSIKHCMENSEIEDGVYLSDLAEYMNMPITDISKAVKKLQQKGYVEWHTDDKKERTYITPTTKAVSEMHSQKESLVSAYSKIIANIDGEDLKTIRLAPAYDIVSTMIYESSTENMALSIDGKYNIYDITRDSFVKEAENVGLGSKIAMKRFDTLVSKFEKVLFKGYSSVRKILEIFVNDILNIFRMLPK